MLPMDMVVSSMCHSVGILWYNKGRLVGEALDVRSVGRGILLQGLCHIHHRDLFLQIVQSLHRHVPLAYPCSAPFIYNLFNFLNNVYKGFASVC